MQDSTSDITNFSALDKFDVELGEYIFILKWGLFFLIILKCSLTEDNVSSEHMMMLASHIIEAIPARNKPYPNEIREGDSMFHHHSDFSINLDVNLGEAEDSGIGTPMEGISSLPEYGLRVAYIMDNIVKSI